MRRSSLVPSPPWLSAALAGALEGAIVAYVGAHPILVSLGMMIFLRGLGEFLTKGGDISGFPEAVGALGHGTVLGLPVTAHPVRGLSPPSGRSCWAVARHGFSVYMVGSNIQASRNTPVCPRGAPW